MHTETAIHPTPATHHRFHLLDALRGLAAILVVFWHAPAYAKLHAAHSTFLAVDFFFCLSGFVIAFSYERRLEGSYGLGRFMAARLIRLYPIFLFGVVTGLILQLFRFAASGTFKGLTACLVEFFCFQIFMLPSVPLAGNPWLFPLDFPAWSLFFELLANFGYAWLIRKQLARNAVLTALFAASILAMGLWPLRDGGIDVGAMHLWRSVLGVPRVILSFVAGVLTMRLYRGYKLFVWRERWSGMVGIAICVCAVLLLLAPFDVLRTRQFSLLTTTLLFPVLVYLGALCRLPARWTPFCSLLGDLSYPVYLFHVHVLHLLELPWTERTADSHSVFRLSLVPAVILATGGVSYLVLKYYDVPFRKNLSARSKSAVRLETVTT